MVTITIDDKTYEVEAGKNLLETCQSLGLDIPYFCWHPAMGSVGSCRQCAVTQYMPNDEKRERGKIVMSCMTPILDGLIVSLGDQTSKQFRSMLIETTMTNHPHDCPVCEEAGECHLQDMTLMSGHIERRYRGLKRTHNNQYLGPFINHEMNRCIACYRCVRFYRDYAGGTDLNVFASRNNVYFGRAEDGVLENEFSGNLAEVCPTGVFTDKTLSEHYTRKWDLQSAPSICTHCSVGCNIYPGEHKGIVRRIQNRFNPLINGHFICDRGRFGYGFVNQDNRLTRIWKRDNATQTSITLDKASAQQQLQQLLNNTSAIAIGSARSSLENNYALRQAVGAENFYAGLNAHELEQCHYISALYQTGKLPSSTVKSIESADVALLVGEDVTQTAPVIALSLRQMTKNAGIVKASKVGVQIWQAAAVKNITQTLKSPVYIINSQQTRLDDIAEKTFFASSVAQTEKLLAIIACLNDENNTDLDAKEIANNLRTAESPVIITGTNHQDAALFNATIQLATTLYQLNHNMRFICALSQSNSMGQALLANQQQHIEGALSRIETNPPETLIIVETDLYRYANKDRIDNALDKINNIIVIEHTLTPTAQTADLLLPSTSFAESIGSWVNFEGRAQTAFAVFNSQTDRQAAWQWLSSHTQHTNIVNELAANIPLFAALPEMHSSNHSAYHIARKTLRATGRTATYATVDIREYPPAQDNDSSYNFSPEGISSLQLEGIIASDKNTIENTPPAYLWAPQWNSNEALGHFQSDINAPIIGTHLGVLLFNSTSNITASKPHSNNMTLAANALLAIPYHNIFADDELSSYVPCMQKRAPEAVIKMNTATAAKKQLNEHHRVSISNGHTIQQLPLLIDESAPIDTVLLPSTVIAQLGQSVFLEAV